MNDFDEALKRVEKYGEYYREYSFFCSWQQTSSILAAILIFLFKNQKAGLILCMIYFVTAVCQYQEGVNRYGSAFDRCRNFMLRKVYSLEYINADGATKWIEIIYIVKLILWVCIMINVFATIL